jgi:hypothetical protein
MTHILRYVNVSSHIIHKCLFFFYLFLVLINVLNKNAIFTINILTLTSYLLCCRLLGEFLLPSSNILPRTY